MGNSTDVVCIEQEHTDVLTACFCAPCVSCRLAREVKNRAAGARGLEAAGGGAARGVHRGGARRAGDGHQASCARACGEYFK